MPKPRSQQISLCSTPYYHCITRCVRRAFLCGEDKQTGQSFEHRRGWVEDRVLTLAKVFAIDVCAFAILHNHTHVILYVDENTAKSWSVEESTSSLASTVQRNAIHTAIYERWKPFNSDPKLCLWNGWNISEAVNGYQLVYACFKWAYRKASKLWR